MDTLVNFPWVWVVGFVGTVFAIFFGLLSLVAGSIALIAWVFYPASLPKDEEDEESYLPGLSFVFAEFYIFIVLVLSAALGLFRSYFPDWQFTFWSAFAGLWFLGVYFASDVLQWELRDLLTKMFPGRQRKAKSY